MLACGRGTSRVFRNNRGVAEYPGGRKVAYGVGPAGGSDLIGWASITITPEMVGQKVAIFTAIECKRSKGGKKEQDQKDFIAAVITAGGRAGFARSAEEAMEIVHG